MQLSLEKWPIWEQFFFSEEPGWLANSEGQGRVPTSPLPPPTARAAPAAPGNPAEALGIWEGLEKGNGGGDRSHRGSEKGGNPSGWTKIYGYLHFQRTGEKG